MFQNNMMKSLSQLAGVKRMFESFHEAGDAIPIAGIMALKKSIVDSGNWMILNQLMRQAKREKINKALASTAFDGATSAAAVIPEDLSKILTEQVHGTDSVPFYRNLPKPKAENVITDYNQLTKLGQYGRGDPWAGEGNLPPSDDSEYSRNQDRIKFAGTLRSISDPMMFVNTGGGVTNLRARENQNGITWLSHQLEMGLLFSKASCTKVKNTEIGVDGLIEQVIQSSPADLIIDKHGRALNEEDVQKAAKLLKQVGRHGFGRADNLGLYCSTTQSEYINNSVSASQRARIAEESKKLAVSLGRIVEGIITQPGGFFPLYDDVWIEEYLRIWEGGPTADEGPRPPAPPSNVTATAIAAGALAAGEVSHWKPEDIGTARTFGVSGIGPNGETAIVQAAATATPLLYGAIDIAWSHPPGNKPWAYNVWELIDGRWYLIEKVPPAASPATTNTYRHLLYWMPNTTPAFALVTMEDVIDCPHLTPPFTLNLGQVDLFHRWAIMEYLTLRLRNPRKVVLFRNCGTTV